MTSDTESIYSRFRARVDDNELAGQDEEIANEILGAYLKSVIAQTYIRKLFTNINFDEDVGEVEYDMREPIDDLADQEFTEELLALGMVVQWVSPRFHSTLNTAQFFSNSDLKLNQYVNTDTVRCFGKPNSEFLRISEEALRALMDWVTQREAENAPLTTMRLKYPQGEVSRKEERLSNFVYYMVNDIVYACMKVQENFVLVVI